MFGQQQPSYYFNEVSENNILIDFDFTKLQRIDVPDNLSLDVQYYAKIIKGQNSTKIKIFKINEMQPAHLIHIPNFQGIVHFEELKFTSEYLIYIRSQPSCCNDIYIHNFKTNYGQSFSFDSAKFITSCHMSDFFYFFISDEKGSCLYRVGRDFNLQLFQEKCRKVKSLESYHKYRFNFIEFYTGLLEFCFLSPLLKPLSIIKIGHAKARGDFQDDDGQIQFLKNIFLINFYSGYFESKFYTLMAQIKNGKRIRKISYSGIQPRRIKQAIFQQYFFVIKEHNELLVHDLAKGQLIGGFEPNQVNNLDDIKVTDNFLAIRMSQYHYCLAYKQGFKNKCLHSQ